LPALEGPTRAIVAGIEPFRGEPILLDSMRRKAFVAAYMSRKNKARLTAIRNSDGPGAFITKAANEF